MFRRDSRRFSVSSTSAVLALHCAAACGGPAARAAAPAPTSSAPSANAAVDGPPPSTTTTEGLGAAPSGTKLEPKPAAPKGEPGRTSDAIAEAIRAKRDDFRACYDRALPAHPGMEGDLTVRFVIDPQGKVTDVEQDVARSTILEPSVFACIRERIVALRFPESGKGLETRANYPFNFHPRPPPPPAKR